MKRIISALLVLILLIPVIACASEEKVEYAIKKFKWGDSKEYVQEIEGECISSGNVNGNNATYIVYSTQVAGLDCLLVYYFCDEGLFQARYILTESHSNEALYINDYSTFRSALTKKYGEPLLDQESWQDNSRKEYYANRKADALSYGYLKYITMYFLDDTIIGMEMSADNYKITTTVDYRSLSISPGEADYSDDI